MKRADRKAKTIFLSQFDKKIIYYRLNFLIFFCCFVLKYIELFYKCVSRKKGLIILTITKNIIFIKAIYVMPFKRSKKKSQKKCTCIEWNYYFLLWFYFFSLSFTIKVLNDWGLKGKIYSFTKSINEKKTNFISYLKKVDLNRNWYEQNSIDFECWYNCFLYSLIIISLMLAVYFIFL